MDARTTPGAVVEWASLPGAERAADSLAERPVVTVPAPRSRKGAARPAPVRTAAFAHLTLEALRDYRGALAAEESRVSYWRRIIQARLDVVRAGTAGRQLDPDLLRPVLSAARVSAGRQALVDVVPSCDVLPLPRLDELWDRRVADDDAPGRALLEADLSAAERQLSDCRSALHRQITEATGELIARYRETPALCLVALPCRPAARPGPRA